MPGRGAPSPWEALGSPLKRQRRPVLAEQSVSRLVLQPLRLGGSACLLLLSERLSLGLPREMDGQTQVFLLWPLDLLTSKRWPPAWVVLFKEIWQICGDLYRQLLCNNLNVYLNKFIF